MRINAGQSASGQTMASDAKTTKADPAPKKEAAVVPAKTAEAAPAKAADATPAKAEGGEKTGGKPANYSRGEGQKAVTQAYKDNWNAIFAPKKTTAKKTKKKTVAKKKTRARNS
jgi:hypothetical protein